MVVGKDDLVVEMEANRGSDKWTDATSLTSLCHGTDTPKLRSTRLNAVKVVYDKITDLYCQSKWHKE